MDYKRIDLATWERGELFRYYMEQMRVVTGMTVDVNVTPLVTYAKRNGLRFYPCMLWVVSDVLNHRDEWKYGWDEEGALIRYDTVSPSHVFFHEERERFVKLVTAYTPDILEFHARVLADEIRYHDVDGVLADQPKNAFDVSCLPWVRYRELSLHVFDAGRHLAPVVTWGKYETENGEQILPLSLQIHHAVADGFHVSRFFLEVQKRIDELESKDQNEGRLLVQTAEKDMAKDTEKELQTNEEKSLS